MASGRDFFGNLLPLSGEAGSGKCAVAYCQGTPTVQMATQTTDWRVCSEHARCACGQPATHLAGSGIARTLHPVCGGPDCA
jgi:hypothetical protein